MNQTILATDFVLHKAPSTVIFHPPRDGEAAQWGVGGLRPLPTEGLVGRSGSPPRGAIQDDGRRWGSPQRMAPRVPEQWGLRRLHRLHL
eukprot:TRINITY_DN3368_c0_g1_i1.p2 TRINITY_DN3368_c0_g1~~TRINITY_DN3368_c0_g1_i1.p2  ORF type:complete len:89 (+),score=21.32 TRINITY_DN3368_c0_g1_i1:212-478(+)